MRFRCSNCGTPHKRYRNALKTKPASYCHKCHAKRSRQTRPRITVRDARLLKLTKEFIETYYIDTDKARHFVEHARRIIGKSK